MTWTDELPMRIGYYWWRKVKANPPIIHEVYFARGALRIAAFSGGVGVSVATVGGQWSGPIQTPEDER